MDNEKIRSLVVEVLATVSASRDRYNPKTKEFDLSPPMKFQAPREAIRESVKKLFEDAEEMLKDCTADVGIHSIFNKTTNHTQNFQKKMSWRSGAGIFLADNGGGSESLRWSDVPLGMLVDSLPLLPVLIEKCSSYRVLAGSQLLVAAARATSGGDGSKLPLIAPPPVVTKNLTPETTNLVLARDARTDSDEVETYPGTTDDALDERDAGDEGRIREDERDCGVVDYSVGLPEITTDFAVLDLPQPIVEEDIALATLSESIPVEPPKQPAPKKATAKTKKGSKTK